MIWVMFWITCAAGGCWQELVEQEFQTEQACQYALDFYRARDGVVGVCTRYTEAE